MIPLSVPNLRGNEKKYLKKCISTEFVSSVGEYVNIFEKNISKFTNSKYAVACSSGTSALHLALRAINIEKNDEVIVPTMSFIATVNPVRYLNASPIFMDCDDFYNLDVNKFKEFIEKNTFFKNGFTINKKTKKKIKAVIPVHVSGNAVDLASILNFCKKKNIKIVEDAAEALGTFYIKGKLKNKHAGTIGDIGCLSFNGNKIITSGGGGMIITNDKKLADKCKYLSTQATDDTIIYKHDDIGYNYRLSNIQAALGVAQLEKIRSFIKKKKDIYNFYKKKIDKIPGLKLAQRPKYADNNNWMMTIILKKEFRYKKDILIKKLFKKNIQTRSMWLPIHLQKKYIEYEIYKISKSIQLFNSSINIPCSTNISSNQMNKVTSILLNI
jgi:perosamine synthetase